MTATERFSKLQAERFRALGTTRPAIVTDWPSAWAPDRRYLLFLAEVGQHEIVRAAAARAVAPIAGPGVPPLDGERLHVTLQPIGYLDALPEGTAAAAIREARAALDGCGPVDVSLAGAGSFAEAAVLWLDPWEPLGTIRDRLLDGVSSLAPARADRERPAEDGGFAPHISIAYYEEPVPAGPIADALSALEPAGRFRIDALALVSVPPPVGAQIAWDVLATFPLTG